MKIALVNQSDVNGGAARAAYRIHQALRCSNIDSHMWVNDAGASDDTVNDPVNRWVKKISKIRKPLAGLLRYSLHTENPVLHSPALFSSRWPERLNIPDIDLVHLHWFNREMMSVRDITRINKPMIWTLHDMWSFCGAEHYTEGMRWQEGYTRSNRPAHDFGMDVNRWVWRRKRKYWQPISIITPSHWLADCVRKSALMSGWPVEVVNNAIDTDVWQPKEKLYARQVLSLPPNVPLLLFGALGGENDPRKGFDLLQEALQHLRGKINGLQLIVFGEKPSGRQHNLGFPIHYTGLVNDDLTLRTLYSAADALVIPSRQDNLPNTGLEALATATPVIAFDTCGLPDIVTHQKTGYLAKAFNTEDLAYGIQWVLTDSERLNNLCENARSDAVARFSYPVIGAQYSRIYKEVLSSFQG